MAQKYKADHVIYASKSQDSKSNPLSAKAKVKYLKAFFPNVNFKAADSKVRTFVEAATELDKKYDHIIMIAGSDRVQEYQRILEKYNGKDFNFDSIEVISAGERDPDSDSVTGISGTKMRNAAKSGDFTTFKKGIPRGVRETDARALFNELRKEYKLEPINEDIKTSFDKLREQYINGELYKISDIVYDGQDFYEVLDVRSNYLLLADNNGDLKRSWYKDLVLAEEPVLAKIDPVLYRWIDKKLHKKEYKKAVEVYMRALDNDPKILDMLNIPSTKNKTKEFVVGRIASTFRNINTSILLNVISDAFSIKNFPDKILRNRYSLQENTTVGSYVVPTESRTDQQVLEDSFQLEYKGYVTKNFHLAPRAREAFTHSIWSAEAEKNPTALLNAIKLVDKILGIQNAVYQDKDIELTIGKFMEDMEKIVDYLEVIDELEIHEDYLEEIKQYMFNVAFEAAEE